MQTQSEQDTERVETTHQSYYMSDKGGYLARWKKLNQAMALKASDYKDPPSIMI